MKLIAPRLTLKVSRKTIKEIVELVRTGQYEAALRRCQTIRRDLASRGVGPEAVPSEILYYGSCALFGLGHVQQAAEWVDAHGEATNFSTANLYLEAFLHLHGRRVDEALGCWTGIIESDPSETLADVLIERIKSEEDRVGRELTAPAAFEQFVPLPWTGQSAHRPGRSFFKKAPDKTKTGRHPGDPSARRPAAGFARRVFALPGVVPSLVAIGVLALVLVGIVWFVPGILRFGQGMVLEEQLPEPPSEGSVVSPESLAESPGFTYTDRPSVLAEYNRARQLALQGRPNQARFLLGKIELSNATFEIKERAVLLRDSLPYLSREYFEDAVTPGQVLANVFLLRGAQVHWRGRVAGPESAQDGLRFRLEEATAVDPPANPSIPSVPLTPAGAVAGTPVRPAPAITVEYRPGLRAAMPELKAGQGIRVFGVLDDKDLSRILVKASEIFPE